MMIDAISTIGEEIKNENVTPIGSPAVVNPINIGILEQLQKGVTVPIKAPRRFPFHPFIPPNKTFVRSGGKYDCIIPIRKISTERRIKILTVSNIKN
ncbi:hypothetical protein HMI01_29060 [Halolactibacillus miurensis]|uniref:Uncharacterized protein n=1 Tax=Halolactibacillus miurensis TaxID=306541 RepID=A0ABQ0VXP1_9BACI|nr:hypothetical protein HMI01_29060 [Halolactibacillus miurensis]